VFIPHDNKGQSVGETEQEEFLRVKGIFLSAFAPIKAAKESLKHQKNISRFQVLATSINHAFQNL